MIKRSEVQSYLTPELYAAYNLWAKIRRYGWPHGHGWIREPAALVEIVELFDDELALLKERNGKRNADNG